MRKQPQSSYSSVLFIRRKTQKR